MGFQWKWGNGTLPLKQRWLYATGSCLFEQAILPCALVKERKRQKISEEQGEAV